MSDGVRRLDEIRDENGVLTHRMCCICFTWSRIADLWVDEKGDRWDICSEECARQAWGVM